MSFCTFIQDLARETLTHARLKAVWEHYNLKNKSPLIDVLTTLLNQQMEKRAKNGDFPIDEVKFKPDEVEEMCKKFRYAIVRKSIQATEPSLETIPASVSGVEDGWKYNPATGLVFASKDGKQVAVRVLVGTKLYPLQLKHMSICISNGWYFETNREGIESPFKV